MTQATEQGTLERILMAADFELTDQMRSVIGVESEPWTVELTTTSVRAFARGVGYTDPVYFDEDAAKAAGYKSLPAPASYLGTPVFIPAVSDPTYGQPSRSGGPRLEHGLKNVLDGGTETFYERTPVAGDVLTMTTMVADLEVKDMKIGRSLVVTNETIYRDKATGDVVARQRGQGIFY